MKKVEFKDREYFSEDWKKRISLMASFLPESTKSVLDVGCGKMWLRDFLREGVAYYGLDYTKRDENTIVCNLNAREFPDIKTDAVFCSGVIEYIHEDNLRWFFGKIRETAPVFVASYCTRDYAADSIYRRKMTLWQNHMYRADLIKMASDSGFTLITEDMIWGNSIFMFEARNK